MTSMKTGFGKTMMISRLSFLLSWVFISIILATSVWAQKQYRVIIEPSTVNPVPVSINGIGGSQAVMVSPGDFIQLGIVPPNNVNFNPLYSLTNWVLGSTNITLDPGIYGADATNTAHLAEQTIYVVVNSTNEVNRQLAIAQFAPILKTLVVSATPTNGGTVSIAGTNGAFTAFTNTYFNGTTNQLTATAQSGYEFTGWSGDVTATDKVINVVMGGNRNVQANFTNVWRISQAFWGGPMDSTTNDSILVRNGTTTNVEVSAAIVDDNPTDTLRFRCTGWTDGNGGPLFPFSGGGIKFNVKVLTNASLTWTWIPQFTVVVNPPDTNGTTTLTSPDGGTDWFDSNAVVTITMQGKGNYIPEKCVVYPGAQEYYPDSAFGTITLPALTNALRIQPRYVATAGTDPGFQAFMAHWGLSTSGTGPYAPGADPDNDGMDNYKEYLRSNTNNGSFLNPLSADTDGDGMDDAYETYSVEPTNLTTQARASKDFYPAATDNGSQSIDNGPDGNPDGDYLWSTTNGYMSADKLTNIEEYKGPDRIPAYTFLLVTTNSAFPIVTNGVTILAHPLGNTGSRPNVLVRIPYVGPLGEQDTGDESKGNTANSDNDNFDDGFEYSWDQWQQQFGGIDEVILVGVTNQVPVYITNAVPVWSATTRVFNPRKTDKLGNGPLAYNKVLYDYKTGKVSDSYLTPELEYGAWQPNTFSPAIGSAPHAILLDHPPKMPDGVAIRRCMHPFLWDVDGDGLPDGYEVIFGYDPWRTSTSGAPWNDGQDNPDGDWMAWSGTNDIAARALTNKWALRNHEVYLADGFDTRVSVDQTYPKCPKPDAVLGKGTLRSPTTEKYSNVCEMRGPDGLMALVPGPSADDATCPINYDSDGDGIWDGWENYVGLNPNIPDDAALDPDGDKLSNLAEFQSYYTSSTNRNALTPLPTWMNKIFPTDPGIDPSPRDTDTMKGADTDGDGIKDGAEKPLFNGDSYGGMSVTNYVITVDDQGVETFGPQVVGYGAWVGTCFVGGGLNPSSSDTDGDTLPDPYEASYASGLDGTTGDAFKDPDGDGLQNYQEYWSCSVYHWQYDVWQRDQASYDNAYFFQGNPKKWDWLQNLYIPLFGPPGKIGPFAYAGTYPTDKDSDGDGMDDFYEIYHGLNPLFGTLDLVGCRDAAASNISADFTGCDPLTQPWTAGHPMADPDGDGLKNYEECPNSLYPSQSPRIHTDPSPLWMTDRSYDRSWVNLYYRPRSSVWYWNTKPWAPPSYAFSFESNEGYDTDTDGLSDKEELNVSKTDPLTPERPVKRRALYLPPGVPAYARTYPGFFAASSDPGGGYLPGQTLVTLSSDALRSFTVEAWVRPVNPASGTDQVVVERPLNIPPGNQMNLTPGLRLNFRLAIGGDGRPYVTYTGDEREPVYGDPKLTAPMVLSNNWTHLAATYQVASFTNASQGGVLSLYVDGILAVRSQFSQLPSTGSFYMGAPIITVVGAPIVVGAADGNPEGIFGDSANQPSPSLFFKGLLDEVRVWDGARSDLQIKATMRKQLRQSDVLAQQNPNPTLKYLFTFDGRPDVDHFATTTGTPLGFDVTASKMFPSGWVAGFWDGTPQKSLMYSDYRYVPWIANIAGHVPEMPPCDIGDSNLLQDVMSGTNVVGQQAKFWNTSNPYGSRYNTYRQFMGQRLDQFNDLLPLAYAQTEEDIAMWDNDSVPALIPYDSDGDGMSDTWEELHGLDPLIATGVNGANGDSDGDGLSNLAEYLARTDPNNADTFGTGFGDYNYRQGAGTQTAGELYDDGDGIPNAWEELYMKVCPSTGKSGLDPKKYDADKDPDEDGWSNYAEYMGSWQGYVNVGISNGIGFAANTNNQRMVLHCDPLDPMKHPEPLVSLHVRYTGRLGSSLQNVVSSTRDVKMSFYHVASMDGGPDATLNLMQDANGDGIPDWWNDRYNAVGANGDPDGDGVDNFHEYLYGTDPWDPTSNQRVSSENLSGANVRKFTTGYIHEGTNYVFAYLDVNGDNQWQPDTEPAGIAQFQPIGIGWGDVNNVEIGLSDSMPGYPRFTWPAVANVSQYIVTNVSGMAVGKTIKGTRNFWHEGDWLNVGAYGAPNGSVVMLIYSNQAPVGYYTNIVATVSSNAMTTPVIVTPHDSVFNYARNEIEFKVSDNAASYRFQIATSSNGTALLTYTNIVPFRDLDGVCKAPLPFYAWDNYAATAGAYASSVWTNGRYWVRIQSANPSTTALSSWSAINLNVQIPVSNGASQFGGDLYYFGKVSHGYGAAQASNLTIIVQTFQSPGFSGVADAQVQVPYTCRTNAPSPLKGPYSLKGLRNGTYYVRAFIDINGNRTLDAWEPVGFAQIPLGDGGFVPQPVVLTGTAGVSVDGIRIVIRDRDTDGDQLPDGWEWMYYGTLAKGANDTSATTSKSLLWCYQIEPADLDPTRTDYDYDGAPDFVEVDWTDAKAGVPANPGHGYVDVNWFSLTTRADHFYNPYDPVSNPSGTDLNPAKWDTDGDGLSDGYEITHGLNPLDPTDGAAEIARVTAAGGAIPGVPAISQIATVTPDVGQFALTWQGQIGMSYEVQYSDDLKTWTAAVNGQRYGDVIHTYLDQSPKVMTRFYRVVVK